MSFGSFYGFFLKRLSRVEECIGRYSIALAAVMFSGGCLANYNCFGVVSYLGIDEGGEIAVQIGATPVHKICNVAIQGTYRMTVASCKIAYASILAAKLADKKITVYYNENGLTCSTLPNWGSVPGVYFIEGPI